MATGDFAVDLEALLEAAGRIGRSVASARRQDLAELTPTEAHVGHADLAVALELFRSRWDSGLSMLCQDAEEVAGRLSRVVVGYRDLEEQTAAAFDALRAQIAAAPRPDRARPGPAPGRA